MPVFHARKLRQYLEFYHDIDIFAVPYDMVISPEAKAVYDNPVINNQ